jgi:uncharacterized protein (DUF2062 family)
MWRQVLRLWSSPRVVLRRVLALDDTPHAIALGAAIGMLVGLTPTVGLQTAEVILFALLTRKLFYFNRAAALTVIYVSNPLTLAPIYYGLYCVGCCFVPGEATLERFQQILTFDGFSGWWQALTELSTDIGLPLAIGTLCVAPVAAIATYPLTRLLLQRYRGGNHPKNEETASTEQQSSQSNIEPAPKVVESAHPKSCGPPLRS